LVDPNYPNIVIASTSSGGVGSATGDITVDPGVPLGIYVSTDGGTSWNRTYTATVEAGDMVLDPQSPGTVYAVVDAQLFKSTNNGTTWLGPLLYDGSIGGGLPDLFKGGVLSPGTRIKLAVSSTQTNPFILFAETYDETTQQGGLYESTNGGSAWTQVPTPSNFCTGCYGRMALAVDPTNPNFIYLGGVNFYRTTDGGNHWTTFYTGYGNVFHEDMQAFAFSPTSHTTLYVGSDGGIWVSTNADSCSPTSCFTDLNLGLDLAQFNSIAANPTNPSNYIGGTQDNGFSQYLGASTIWQMKGTLYNGESQFDYGDNGWTAFDLTKPSTMYAASPNGGFLRSDDGGAHWNQFYYGGNNPADPSAFEFPVAMDPSTPSTLYLGTDRLWKTTNMGNHWFLPDPGLPVTVGTTVLSAIAVAPSDGQYVYVGTEYGAFFASTDGGSHFVEKDTGLPPNRLLTGMAVDPKNPQKVYVTFSGFGGMHVFETTSAGTSWSDLTSNLPDLPTNTILLDSINGVIYVGTDGGVFSSTNGGTSWAVTGTGLPNVPVYDLAFGAGGTLVAATYGRGVWTLAYSGSDFKIFVPSTKTMAIGDTDSIQITIESLGGFSSPVTLNTLPPTPSGTGISLTLNTNSVTPPANGQASASLTIIISSSATPGTYSINVQGRSMQLAHTATLLLTINSTPLFGNCLIATASFGTPMAPEVQLLRNFRDNSIMTTRAGASFMIAFNAWYYSFSPGTAAYLRTHWVERTVMRGALYPLIGIMSVSSTTFNALRSSPEIAVIISGLMASSLLGAFYLGLPLGLLTATVRRLRIQRRLKLPQFLLTVTLLIGFVILMIGELFNLAPLLIISTSTLVLSTILLSATLTSKAVAGIRRRVS
jgi:photosystem II stability/assembly factor-like uncharacterized protein